MVAHSGKCLQEEGTGNYALVAQYTCSGSTGQQIEYIDKGSGYYQLRYRESGRCLDNSWATYNGAPLMIYDCHDGINQQWYGPWGLTSNSNPSYYYHYNRFSGKYMAILGSDPNNGGDLVQWDLYTDPNFRFYSMP
jgi:agarase